MHGPLSARPQLHGGILSFRLGLMCAADQEADLLVRETNAWQQTHGSKRMAARELHSQPHRTSPARLRIALFLQTIERRQTVAFV